jgi:L-ascorbate metabolism protein UlaG (beta-lactamase superfamily)
MRTPAAATPGDASVDGRMSGPGAHHAPLDGDHVVWGGHATTRIVLGGTAVITDPVLRDRVVHLRREVPLVDGVADGVSGILISHLHHDHLDLPSLARIDRDVPVVVGPGAGRALGRRNRRPVIELAPGEVVTLGGVRIRATRADHDGRRPGRRGIWAPALGFVVSRGGNTVYFAGDTGLFDGMDEIEPGLTCALVPIWGWGPTLGAGHLDPEQAADALRLLAPRMAVPIHWGTYRSRVMRSAAPAPGGAPEQRFLAAAALRAPGVDVRVVRPGGRVDFGAGTGGPAAGTQAPVR